MAPPGTSGMGALEEAAARALGRPGAAAQFRLDAAAVAGGLRPAALLDYVPVEPAGANGVPRRRRGNRGKEVRDWEEGGGSAGLERAQGCALARGARAAAARLGGPGARPLVGVLRGTVMLFSAEHSARLLQAQLSIFAHLKFSAGGRPSGWQARDTQILPGACQKALELLLLRGADGGGADEVLDLDQACAPTAGRASLAPSSLVGWLLGYPVVYCFEEGGERAVAEVLGGAALSRVAVRALSAEPAGSAAEIAAFTFPTELPGAAAAVVAFSEHVQSLSGRIPELGSLEISCRAVEANSCVIAI